MASTIRVLHNALHKSFDSLTQLQPFDFEKLTYEISENLESFLISQEIEPVYGLSKQVKEKMMKVVMLLEDVENLEFTQVESSYKRCLNMLKSADLLELNLGQGEQMKIGNISNINLDCLKNEIPISDFFQIQQSNQSGEEEQIPVRELP